VTSGMSYQEFKILNINAWIEEYRFPGFDDVWPAALYRIVLKRSGGFYIFASILPGIIVTVLSFAVFFADTSSADALGYGITVIVVNLLLNVVLASMLPICGELIWIDLFSTVNTIFCFISLTQSTINVMIENSDSDHSLPDWVIFLGRALARLLCSVAPPALRKAILRRVDPLDVGEDDVLSDNPKQDPVRLLSSANALGESVAGLLYRQHMSIAQGPQGERTTTTECADHGQPLRGLLRGDVEGDDDGAHNPSFSPTPSPTLK